jgi:hypothetical protein
VLKAAGEAADVAQPLPHAYSMECCCCCQRACSRAEQVRCERARD